MRTHINLVIWLTVLFFPVPSFLMASDEPGYWHPPYRAVGDNLRSAAIPKPSSGSPAWVRGLSMHSGTVWYGFSWDQSLVPAASSDLRSPSDGRVFESDVDPGVRVGFSRSSLQLHRRGLKYYGADDAWSVGLKYHRMKVASELELRIDERTERPNVLKVEWSVRFE